MQSIKRRQRSAQLPWTRTRIRSLRRIRSTGATGDEIARQLGEGMSKNAVSAKIRRLGMARSRADANRDRGVARRLRSRPWLCLDPLHARNPSNGEWLFPALVFYSQNRPAKEGCPDDACRDAHIPVAQRRSLLQLDSGACRWPVGDPSARDFFFCGAMALVGKPYCAEHCARAYRATSRQLGGSSCPAGIIGGEANE